MSRLSEQDRDDAYGPRLGGGRAVGAVIALAFLANFLVSAVLSGEVPWPVSAALAVCVTGLIAYCAWIARSRRMRLQTLRSGRLCQSRLLSKDVKVWSGQQYSFEPEYWLTVQYSIDGVEQTVRVQVTDRVYYRADRARPIYGRVLPSRPTQWVPDSAASAAEAALAN